MTTTWNKKWNSLDSDVKRNIARAAGFSESESALLSKLYWEGFPVFIITQLQAVEWSDIHADRYISDGIAADRARGIGRPTPCNDWKEDYGWTVLWMP